MFSPQRIIMGGGVLSQERLLPMIRQGMQHWLGGYIEQPAIRAEVERYIVLPALGARSVELGALRLAAAAAGEC